MVIKMKSTVFDEGEPIPTRYTCDGVDISPPLEWDVLPENTESIALICEDPDAPGGLGPIGLYSTYLQAPEI